MSTAMGDRHLTDAELLRVLEPDDTTTGPTGRAGLTRHLEACDRCAQALSSLDSDSRLITRFLEAADFEDGRRPRDRDTERWRGARAEPTPRSPAIAAGASPGRRVTGSPWLKAAAILVLVAGPLAAFPGVRSWVAERVTGPAEPAPAAPAAVVPEEPTVLRFTPDPGDFVVRFPAGAAGAITLERSSTAEAELRATGQPETVVSASSLEVLSEAEGRYRLRLPTAVTGAWVVVGDRSVAVNDRQIDRRTVITLDG